MRNEIKNIVKRINKKVKEEANSEWFKTKYIESDEVEIVILEDYESNYHETIVIYEDKAHFFGDNYPNKISKEAFIKNLKENWEL